MAPDKSRPDQFGAPLAGLLEALDSLAPRVVDIDAGWDDHMSKVLEATRTSSRGPTGDARANRRSLLPPVMWTAAVIIAIAVTIVGFHVGSRLDLPSLHTVKPSHPGSTKPPAPTTRTTRTHSELHAGSPSWSLVPPYGVSGFSAPYIWDGTEFIVGIGNQDAAYNPTSRKWRTLPAPPQNRTDPFAVWTGEQLLVFGGTGGGSFPATAPEVNGSAFTPRTDRWTPIATMPAEFDIKDLVGGAVWTGTEAVVWATNGTQELVAAFDPVSDTWRTLPASGMPVANGAPVKVFWTGTQVLVWKATQAGYPVPKFAYGGLLDPATGKWTEVAAPPDLLGGYGDAVTWTADGLFVWSGQATSTDSQLYGTGAMYEPSTNSWKALEPSPLADRVGATAVWTGRQVLVFGGRISGSGTSLATDNASYDPATTRWVLLPSSPPSSQIPGDPLAAATARWFAFGAWDGHEAIVLGGDADSHSQGLFDGFVFEPMTNP